MIGIPMLPSLDNIVQQVAWSLSMRQSHLLMLKQLVIPGQFVLSDTDLHQLPSGFKLHRSGFFLAESADKRNLNAVLMVLMSVSSLLVPSATNVDETVTTDQKIVANVEPTMGFNMKRLNRADVRKTLCFRITTFGSGMAYHHVWCWYGFQVQKSFSWWSCAPF